MKTKQENVTVWVAMDESGDIYLYGAMPEKVEDLGMWCNISGDYFCRIKSSNLPEGINPKWGDEEPVEVEITIRRKSEGK